MDIPDVPVLSAANADWLCLSCNQQNFAKLQSGSARTKCFKCGTERSDGALRQVIQVTQIAGLALSSHSILSA